MATTSPSYYAAAARPRTPHRPLAGDVACEVCVVGGGYCGLWTALELAKRGCEVVVLEADEIGIGASGRNGGQMLSGFAADMTQVAGDLGLEAAGELWKLAEEAKDALRGAVTEYGIECGLSPGHLQAALKPRHMRGLAAELDLWTRLGYRQARLVAREEMPTLVASPLYIGGLLDDGGGHLDPLGYIHGLAAAAEGCGVHLYEATPARGIGTSPALAVTDHGTVRARHVVLCTHAATAALLPSIEGLVMPVSTWMVATERLGEERAKAVIPANVAVSDCNAVLDYYRLSADGRLLFGGGASYWRGGRRPAEGLMRRLREVFPQLSNLTCEWAWQGTVAITARRLPLLGREEGGLWYATGFSGQGVALTSLAGKAIAAAIAGDRRRFDLLASITHRRFPGGCLRAPLLAAAMAWHRLRDLR